MGALISSLGMGAGGSTGRAGINFEAGSTPIQMPVTTQDAQGLAQQSLQSLDQQKAFTQALQAQNGIGNQSNIYSQLGGVAAGTGPNPAQSMLNQATGANTANQAALMAGQRGAGANAGLIARQAAMQGAANQQNAVGQGATMQANQSLNALNMQGGIAGQQVSNQANAIQNQNVGVSNEQQNLLNAIAAQNNANVAMQSNQNNTNAALAQQVAKGQQDLAGGLLKGTGGSLGVLGGVLGLGGQAVKGIGSLFSGSGDGGGSTGMDMGGISGGDMASSGGAGVDGSLGGLAGGAGDAGELADFGSMVAAKGGMVPNDLKKVKYADGGDVEDYSNSDESGQGNKQIQSVQVEEPIAAKSAQGLPFDNKLSAPTIADDPTGPQSSVGKYLKNPTPTSNSSTDEGAALLAKGPLSTSLGAGLSPIDVAHMRNQLEGPQEQSRDWSDDVADVADSVIGAVAGSALPIGALALNGANTASAATGNGAGMAKGGKVPAMVSPGEIYLNKAKAQAVAKGKESPMQGELIPGKAKVKGDSLKNDTVPKTLEAGGVVIPRSIMQAPDAAKKAAAFVTAHLAKHGHMPRKA